MARGLFWPMPVFFRDQSQIAPCLQEQLDFFLYEEFIVSSFSRQISKNIAKVRQDGDMS